MVSLKLYFIDYSGKPDLMNTLLDNSAPVDDPNPSLPIFSGQFLDPEKLRKRPNRMDLPPILPAEYFYEETETVVTADTSPKALTLLAKTTTLSSESYALIASHPKATVKALDILSVNSESPVRLAVAKNKNASAAILKNLSSDSSAAVRAAVALHQHTSVDDLGRLRFDVNLKVRENLASNSKLTAAYLDFLASTPNNAVKAAVAAHRNTLPETLADLAEENYTVALNVAANFNTPPKALTKLIEREWNYEWQEEAIKKAVARNNNTSYETLMVLWNENSDEIAVGLAKNSHAPVEILLPLTNSSIDLVRFAAVRSLNESNAARGPTYENN